MINAMGWLGLMSLIAFSASPEDRVSYQSQAGLTRVEFSASTKHAYEGQVIDLQLTIRLPARSTSYSITIPWLETSFSVFEGVLPTEQWLCEYTLPKAEGLPLRWQQHTLYAPMIRPGEFELHWQIRILTTPESGEPIRLDAITIESMKSQPIAIQVQPRPSVGISPTAWDLGIGSYQVKAIWQNNAVMLGEEDLLLLEVSGQGDLSGIRPPTLTLQPGWERDAYLLEPTPETWKDNGQVRAFRYRIRPRRLGAQTPPGVTVQFLDPKSNSLQTMRIRVPSLVVSSGEMNQKKFANAQDPLAQLPEPLRYEFTYRQQFLSIHLILIQIAMWIPAVFVLLVIGRSAVRAFFADVLKRWHWRWAAQRALRQIDSKPELLGAEQLRKILAQFLSRGLERKISEDAESIQLACSAAPFADKWQLLVQGILELDFGPNEYLHVNRVRDAARQFFLEMESGT